MGSGAWTALSTIPGIFGNSLLYVKEQQSSGVSSVLSLSVATWGTIPLNTVTTNEISGATLVSNQLSLPSGTYYIDSNVLIATTGNAVGKARLRNITAGTTIVVGGNSFFSNSSVMLLPIKGRFTLGSTATIELQGYLSASTSFVNIPASSGESEVYSQAFIWKIS